jgi:putative Mn2+ efflux pump MntP
MNLATIVLIALGLAMDAFAVCVASAANHRQLRANHALRMATLFGGFQAVMPLLGWLAGHGLKTFITGADHWVAFALLSAIGGKMIYESGRLAGRQLRADPAKLPVVLVLAIATSIDALAVGITLPFLARRVVPAAATIGLVTFVLSYLGVEIGKKVGHFFEGGIEAIGGCVLITLGAKILFEHLF